MKIVHIKDVIRNKTRRSFTDIIPSSHNSVGSSPAADLHISSTNRSVFVHVTCVLHTWPNIIQTRPHILAHESLEGQGKSGKPRLFKLHTRGPHVSLVLNLAGRQDCDSERLRNKTLYNRAATSKKKNRRRRK